MEEERRTDPQEENYFVTPRDQVRLEMNLVGVGWRVISIHNLEWGGGRSQALLDN